MTCSRRRWHPSGIYAISARILDAWVERLDVGGRRGEEPRMLSHDLRGCRMTNGRQGTRTALGDHVAVPPWLVMLFTFGLIERLGPWLVSLDRTR